MATNKKQGLAAKGKQAASKVANKANKAKNDLEDKLSGKKDSGSRH